MKDKSWRLQQKTLVLTHYGDGKLQCMRCGFEDIRALSLDHIAGGGNEHRKTHKSSAGIYAYLKVNNYPQGYQTLCMNCQFIKRFENNEHNYYREHSARRLAELEKEAATVPIKDVRYAIIKRHIQRLKHLRFSILQVCDYFNVTTSDKEYQVICVSLCRLVEAGVIKRIAHGMYELVLPSHTNETNEVTWQSN